MGALGVLVEQLEGQLETLGSWLDDFKRLHESAAYRVTRVGGDA